jgi:glutathione synthase/RimK-type ligase-like ATP-grasp enzyme
MVYPSLQEIYVYENKRYLSYWLKAKAVPHPETHVFYHQDEAMQFVRSARLPLVAKLNIGASGNGVVILKDRSSADDYVERIFGEGVSARTGPRVDKGKMMQRTFYMLTHPTKLRARLSKYKSVAANPQKGFCIFQEFIPHTFEWRVVRIGDSFFAHKKMVKGEKASGSLIKGYDNPPLSLFDFSKEITDRVQFRSQALDIFETADGRYLVNEMQCIFGQSDPYQMLVDDKPGRYIHVNGQWIFEEGMFNQNESFNLRLKDVLFLLGRETH